MQYKLGKLQPKPEVCVKCTKTWSLGSHFPHGGAIRTLGLVVGHDTLICTPKHDVYVHIIAYRCWWNGEASHKEKGFNHKLTKLKSKPENVNPNLENYKTQHETTPVKTWESYNQNLKSFNQNLHRFWLKLSLLILNMCLDDVDLFLCLFSAETSHVDSTFLIHEIWHRVLASNADNRHT